MESVQQIITNQRQFFQNGDTLNESFRRKNLEKLRKMLQDHEKEIYQALKEDLNKSNHETYTTELGFLLVEIDVALKNLKKWMEVEKVETPMTHTGTNSRSEEHTSELQSRGHLVCRLLLEKKTKDRS